MKPSLLSIIVPVYNTGIYLKECILSILNQTYSNLEIIIIDDGSEAKTAELCDHLSKIDSRIKVLHKKNEGVSKARNIGLDIAQGEYIGFVDSDDTIVAEMYEKMISAIEKSNAQIAMCDSITIYPDLKEAPDTIKDYEKSTIIHTNSLKAETLSRLAGSVWRCVYRRNERQSKQIFRFPEGIKFSEDRIFNLIAMGLAEKIVYLKDPCYRRLIRKGSACFRFYPDMTSQIVEMRRCLLNAVNRYWGEKYLKVYEAQIAGHIRYAITNFTSDESNLTSSVQLQLIKDLCINSEVRDCINQSRSADMRNKMITSNRYYLLYIIGKLINLKHKICHIGQFQS